MGTIRSFLTIDHVELLVETPVVRFSSFCRTSSLAVLPDHQNGYGGQMTKKSYFDPGLTRFPFGQVENSPHFQFPFTIFYRHSWSLSRRRKILLVKGGATASKELNAMVKKKSVSKFRVHFHTVHSSWLLASFLQHIPVLYQWLLMSLYLAFPCQEHLRK